MITCTARSTSQGSLLDTLLDELTLSVSPCALPAAYQTHLGPRCSRHAEELITVMMEDNSLLYMLLQDFSQPHTKAEARARYLRGID